MIVRSLILAGALLIAAAAPAAAAEVTLNVGATAGVRLGQDTALAGVATEGGVPLAGREVRLEVKRHPFKGGWKRRGTQLTRPDGRFAFSPQLDRNHDVRVRLIGQSAGEGDYLPVAPDTLSPVRHAYVLPAFTLVFTQRRRNVIRITQTYTVPKDATLSAPTRFYVGPCRLKGRRCTAARAPLRARAATKRLQAGRYRAAATVRIPRDYDGRFQYVSCFAYSPGSGMGDPKLSCPRATARLRR